VDTQVLNAILASIPTMLVVLIGILLNNSRLSDLKNEMNARFGDINGRVGDVNSRFTEMNARISELRSHMDARFDDVDRRFDEMKDLWRSELHRVEEVLDARLKHLEQR
jgi:chaperonin cofactor prefoldin